jgi:hypothetical protein
MKNIFLITMVSVLVIPSYGLQPEVIVPQYQVFELAFKGSQVLAHESPVRDIILETSWVHEQSKDSRRIFGFWDGDGKGGSEGNVHKIRFCPDLPGKWTLLSVSSNDPLLDSRHEGYTIHCTPSDHPGFWLRDTLSRDGRWYRRSDGSHPYIVGNTLYSFISEYYRGEPTGNSIEEDIRNCARYFNKVRFAMTGDIYPHPEDKPFLDLAGKPTDDGNFSHRPNPAWFSRRVDLAVMTAFEEDMIADIIINSVDSPDGRSVLQPAANGGDAAPILRYMAARYGSYPNVWFCMSNEYNIRKPNYKAEKIRELGTELSGLLAYPTPLSVHPNQMDWDPELHRGSNWNDHVIFQNKIKRIWLAADKADLNYYRGDMKPVINDELAYEGEGDGWSEEDVLVAFLGTFLGGAYGSTGYKTGHKLGHYFAGNFDPAQHRSSDNLLWFRTLIDKRIPFWNMSPHTIVYTRKSGIKMDIFDGVDYDFRLLKERGSTYVLGASGSHEGISADLPEGDWEIYHYDLIGMSETAMGSSISGTFTFDLPDLRAQMVVFQRQK